jgi:hypothetical protein
MLAEQTFDDKGVGGWYVTRPNEGLVLTILPRPQERCPGLLSFRRKVGIGSNFCEEGFCGHSSNLIDRDGIQLDHNSALVGIYFASPHALAEPRGGYEFEGKPLRRWPIRQSRMVKKRAALEG